MPFSRSARTDRRRRVMREAVASDPGVAAESVRAKQRQRSRQRDADDSSPSNTVRDPGYSQAVRRACQQRLVQLIPVRRLSLALMITSVWGLWTVLMLAHYFVHVKPVASTGLLPIAYLVHLRSAHGIAHWLGGQLWMLTALASLMIFQLRKHKLDDYRAKYRVWGFLAIAALVSSLDASSSGLYLFGKSIDAWTLREVGYSGWSVVLATFAALVGVLGLRICSEIKSAPMSLLFWLGGLLSWAVSALIGTGLMVAPWSKTTTDMVVGGTWLGGILSVFLAAGIFLRHTYIQAQKRFVLRNGLLSQRTEWKMPRFRRRVDSVDDTLDASSEANDADGHDSKKRQSVFSKFRMPWRRGESVASENIAAVETKRKSPVTRKQRDDDDTDAIESQSERRPSQTIQAAESSSESKKRSWLRMPRWRSDPRLGDDYSDVAAERRVRDDGFEAPFGKKRGWFSRKRRDSTDVPSGEHSSGTNSNGRSVQSNDYDRDESVPDFQEVGTKRKSWWSRTPKTKTPSTKTERKPAAKSKDGSEKKRQWFRRSSVTTSFQPDAETKPKSKNWGVFKKRSADTANQASPSKSTEASGKPKRKLFGFLDNLKLKPPAAGGAKSSPTPVSTSRSAIPSSSAAQRNEPSKPTSSNQEYRQPQGSDDEDYEDDSTRNLSKADRKRLRRQQQDNRRVA
ncbi:MAG: hypothetical protein SGI77_26525 [Pirellulaceae bacterium]|nr:hypothetical protein [Pirellulaceae bacterium]